MNILGWITMALMSQRAVFGDVIQLPGPEIKGRVSLEESLSGRRSVRRFASTALTVEQIGQLLWAAQGITEKQGGLRAAPSSGALFPLETYVVLPDGVYHYDPQRHELARVIKGDRRRDLQKAAMGQGAVGRAPAVFVFAAVYERTAAKYGGRATRYVDMEVGHACQNLLLQATALGLGGVPMGAFHDDRLADLLKLPAGAHPLYLVPIGFPD